MNNTLKKYPKDGTHWEKNVWKERFEKELRQRLQKYPISEQWIKEILGE